MYCNERHTRGCHQEMLYFFEVINLKSFSNKTQVITEKAIQPPTDKDSPPSLSKIWEQNVLVPREKGEYENQLYTDLSD